MVPKTIHQIKTKTSRGKAVTGKVRIEVVILVGSQNATSAIFITREKCERIKCYRCGKTSDMAKDCMVDISNKQTQKSDNTF
jgi:hypothetical protein